MDELAYQKFRVRLFDWYRNHERPLPWKDLDDPYLIWISEIMLQQTRSGQAWDYFISFSEVFPTVKDLAAASRDEVLAQWKGLGYYARARHLHDSARYVVEECNGEIPDNYEELLELKGVGPYTASAIASFAFNAPHAVLDGNVHRVLSRFMGWEKNMDTSANKQEFQALADRLIDPDRAGMFNQAMMDLGAVICTPAQPLCSECPLSYGCTALQEEAWNRYPPARRRPKVKSRFFHYLVYTDGEQITLQKRREDDIWKGLYELPLLETPDNRWLNIEELKALAGDLMGEGGSNVANRLASFQKVYIQTLSHQKIHGRFYLCLAEDESEALNQSFRRLSERALPRIVDCFLEENYIYLNNLSI